MEDEIPQLETLVRISGAVEQETKIQKILDVLDTQFEGRSVLFFTEYKATQALLMSEIIMFFLRYS